MAGDAGLVFNGTNLRERLPDGLPASLAGRKVVLGVRSEHVDVGRGTTPGRAQLIEPLGDESLVFFEFGGVASLVAKVDPETALRPGDNLTFGFNPAGYHVFDAQTGVRLN